jgi:class 3 adenylate cyclase
VLQEEVMEFVNSIAKIVHTEVARHGGSANKNIGDAFLLVWKFPPEVAPEDVAAMAAGETPRDPAAAAAAAEVADAALAAFVQINAALRRSGRMASYAANPRLNARIPGFRVRMGFGLHVGWAIEGAIGSLFKVDASYLSPNVNMASRLEAATKQYDVPLLLSDDFVRLLSPGGRRGCRQIDRVTVKGSARPVGLHTFDADADFLPAPNVLALPSGALSFNDATAAALSDGRTSGDGNGVGHHANRHGGGGVSSGAPVDDELICDKDIVAMRATVDPAFLARFGAGYTAYAAGRWGDAKALLEGTAHARHAPGGGAAPDGPSRTLLAVMAAHGYTAPASWAGYRELTDK